MIARSQGTKPRGRRQLPGHNFAVHEHRALAPQIRGRGGLGCKTRKLVHDRHAQMVCLLLQERSGASRADFVHHEVIDMSVPDVDIFRVLAADLENRVDIRRHLDRAAQLARDLVLDQVRTQQVPI